MDPIEAHKRSIRAHTKMLVRRGKLKKAEACEECDETEQIEAHHLNWKDPYAVVWLCVWCNRKPRRRPSLRGLV